MDPTTDVIVGGIAAVLVVAAGIEMALTRRPRRPRRQLSEHAVGVVARVRSPYRHVMAKLGAYLSMVKADDFYIGELTDGYLVLYTRKGVQAVETLTFAQVAGLSSVIKSRSYTEVQRHLESIGRFLDSNAGVSVAVFPRNDGYAIEYATFSQGQHMAAAIARVNRYMDSEALERLAGH